MRQVLAAVGQTAGGGAMAADCAALKMLWHNRGLARKAAGVISSAVEHCLHTAGVAGSNPASPTRINKQKALWFHRAFFVCNVGAGFAD